MKKNALLALLTALCCCGSLGLGASAMEAIELDTEFSLDVIGKSRDYNMIEGASGELIGYSAECHPGFVMMVDPETFSEETLPEFPHYETHERIVWDDFYQSMYDDPENPVYEQGTVFCYVTVSDCDALVTNVRQYALEQEGVLETMFVHISHFTDYHNYTDLLRLELAEGIMPTEALLPELTNFVQNSDGSWTAQLAGETAGAFAAVRNPERTSYAEHAWRLEFEAMLLDKYADILVSASHDHSSEFIEQWSVQGVVPAWDGYGDPNADGIIDAEDAAGILAFSADLGAGRSMLLLSESAADINLDAEIDSKDAAQLLQYATLVGSGQSAALPDFVKQTMQS